LVQIFSSAPFSQTPSVYVPPLLSETTSYINTNIYFLKDDMTAESTWLPFQRGIYLPAHLSSFKMVNINVKCLYHNEHAELQPLTLILSARVSNLLRIS
jgi:hypothetical protein